MTIREAYTIAQGKKKVDGKFIPVANIEHEFYFKLFIHNIMRGVHPNQSKSVKYWFSHNRKDRSMIFMWERRKKLKSEPIDYENLEATLMQFSMEASG